ncbi:MAG: insulinase family protein [bacterium]|nr:insulinase family protein [bacterium]
MKLPLAPIALAALCALCPHAASAAMAPTMTQVAGVSVITQPDAVAPLVDITLVVRAGLDRQSMAQSGLAALAAETVLRTPVDGTAAEDAIAGSGGAFTFAVDPSDVRFSIQALPSDANAVLDIARRALAQPRFDALTVGEARNALFARIADDQQRALQVGLDMLSGTLASSANQGLPPNGIPGSLAQFDPAQVAAFYHTYYRRGGATVSAVGPLDELKSDALATLAQSLPDGATHAVAVHVPKLDGTSRQLVAHRNVSAPWLIAQYPAPAIGSKDFGAMLVLAAFMQRTLADIAQVPGVVNPTLASNAVGAIYQYDRAQPSLTLYVNGGIGDPNRTFSTVLSVANVLASTKLQGSIDEFKAMAKGDFVNGASSVQSRAWLAVVFAQSGASPDYVGRSLAAIDATTAADLQRVAKSYLGNPAIALVLPRARG